MRFKYILKRTLEIRGNKGTQRHVAQLLDIKSIKNQFITSVF